MAEGTLVITISNQSIHVSVITVTGAGSATTISTDRGTLQMSVHVDPHDAVDQTVVWSVIDGTGSATIDVFGLLSALTNGTVTVRATAADGSLVYGELEITISNQAALTSIPDSRDFSLRDVCNIVVPTLDTLRNCFWDASATLFDPTHVAGFDPRYEGNHDRLSNFRNYPIVDYSTSGDDFGALYNWHAIAGGNDAMTYGALYNWYAATKVVYTYMEDYGALYNWYVASYSTGGASIAPTGCHVPTLAEWDTLSNFYGIDNPDFSDFNPYIGSGRRIYSNGEFDGLNEDTYFWSITNYGNPVAHACKVNIDPSYLATNLISRYKFGYAIRCLVDDTDYVGTITDYDGNIYNTVIIGTQCWLTENLKVEHYNDGTSIPIVTDNTAWAALTTGAMCYYDNAVESGVQLIAPTGWHVPTLAEVQLLVDYLIYPTVGSKLKEIGDTYWLPPNADATNETGFNARGAGQRAYDTGDYTDFKNILNIWCSDQFDNAKGYGYSLAYSTSGVTAGLQSEKQCGFSIRPIKDDATDPGTLTDIDGNVYPTVTIGTQVWMAENLRVTHYNNGTDIPLLTEDADWIADTAGAMCFYENGTPAYTAKSLAPTGWHVPTITEWNTLITFLGGEDIAGGYLKEEGTDHWNLPNAYATDDYGFSAYGGGWREFQGNFGNIKDFGFFWSSTDFDISNAYRVFMDTWDAFLISTNSIYTMGFSVRCIKDDDTDPGTVTDIDGNVYNTIKIDDQVWMASNFKAIHYNDGTSIPNITDNTDWYNDRDGAYCWYNNMP